MATIKINNGLWKCEIIQEYYCEIGHSKYADEFSLGNRTLMKRGKAPFAVPERWNGKYVIHHRKPIHDGGGVYDLGNILISTLRFHLDILDRNYHFNK